MTRYSSADFDAALGDALRPTAIEAPLPADLLDVPDSWVRRDRHSAGARDGVARPRPIALAVVIGSAVVVALLATAILSGIFQAPRVGDPDEEVSLPLRSLDLEPTVIRTPSLIGIQTTDATGPVVQLASGNGAGSPFRLVAYRSAQGYCLGFTWQGQGGDGCGALPQDDAIGGRTFGLTLYRVDPDVPGYLAGFVAPDVAEVHAEATRGGHAEAFVLDLGRAEIEARAFMVFLPIGFEADNVVAFDADGEQVGRFVFNPGAPPSVGDPGDDPSREPGVYAVLRNHTGEAVDLRVEERTASSEGYAAGPVPACDVGASGIGLFEGKTWWVDVDGVEIFHSDEGAPAVGSGEVLELVIDLREGQGPVITDFVVVPVEESVGGAAAGRAPRIGWSERLWSLADDLECDFDPESF